MYTRTRDRLHVHVHIHTCIIHSCLHKATYNAGPSHLTPPDIAATLPAHHKVTLNVPEQHELAGRHFLRRQRSHHP